MGYDTSPSRTFAPLDRTLFDTTPDLCGAVNLTLAALHLQSTACRKYFFPLPHRSRPQTRCRYGRIESRLL